MKLAVLSLEDGKGWQYNTVYKNGEDNCQMPEFSKTPSLLP